MFKLFLLFFIFKLINLEPILNRKSTYYWSQRSLECINHGLNISRCSLFEEGRITELNPGCFDELNSQNKTLVYCRLKCEESDEATVLRKEPSNNHICASYHTYNLERRRRDWYIWRSGECINTTIKFVLRCGFPRDPRVFYAQNKHLFEYDDFTTIRNIG
uniref:DUF7808 domain-containing protein n=1 Tax=Meloidogyne incognita TaxID=6306 RepID=A0A914KJ65_MELIC